MSHCISSILGGLAVALRFLYLTNSLHPKHSFRHCKIEVHGFMEQSLSTNLMGQNARQTSIVCKRSDTVCISLRPLTSKFGFGFGQVQVGEGQGATQVQVRPAKRVELAYNTL